MSDLAQLIGLLEKASEGSRELDLAIACAITPRARPHKYERGCYQVRDEMGVWDTKRALRLTTSLDAIVALIERKLPGCGWAVGKRPSGGGWARVFRPTGPEVYIEASTPTLALCIAFLRALQAQQEVLNAPR